ncbi:XRE family transcriptional regulator [Halobacteriovorax sp. GB3]|uniref:XRE family transcriptional regulator n=1 Tax=Halobacteriovorax sp. GB3 TaxID=2719615 RepID=UPI0023604A86|nr:XRE family transcriptional regulator [Halobacteriovorax sp. GB3]MDD0854684.1 XRE family transcriptional regulator [Halobacteriovorax sp. GB3]
MKVTKKHVIKFVLGIKLKQLRKKASLSLKELAEKSGLSASYLNEIEKGKKYPKLEKIQAIADVLNVSSDHLASTKLGKSLHPLTHFVESDLFNKFPAELFGINDQDIYDLMSHSPEKFASFLVAVLELARSYDISPEDVFNSALRSYQESYNNYFVDLENLSLRAREEYSLNEMTLSIEALKKTLIDSYDYIIDETKLSENEETQSVRSYFKIKKNKNYFLLNQNLTTAQKRFVLARELGYCYLGIKRTDERDFTSKLGHFRASYFSGALLMPSHLLVRDLKDVFQNKEFKGELFLGILQKYGLSSEVLMHRLTQILPEYFGLNQLFFLKFTNNFVETPEDYKITSELHLSQMHAPHGQRLKEHYCRRWVTVDLLKGLGDKIKNSNDDQPLLGTQRSTMNGHDADYFCVSIARPSKLKPGSSSCITIGILIDEYFKDQVKFWKDEKVPSKVVSQTCERCTIMDCESRAAKPIHVIENQKRNSSKVVLESIINDL